MSPEITISSSWVYSPVAHGKGRVLPIASSEPETNLQLLCEGEAALQKWDHFCNIGWLLQTSGRWEWVPVCWGGFVIRHSQSLHLAKWIPKIKQEIFFSGFHWFRHMWLDNFFLLLQQWENLKNEKRILLCSFLCMFQGLRSVYLLGKSKASLNLSSYLWAIYSELVLKGQKPTKELTCSFPGGGERLMPRQEVGVGAQGIFLGVHGTARETREQGWQGVLCRLWNQRQRTTVVGTTVVHQVRHSGQTLRTEASEVSVCLQGLAPSQTNSIHTSYWSLVASLWLGRWHFLLLSAVVA